MYRPAGQMVKHVMSAFNPSGPAEILRAEQKDEELCERIDRQLSEFLLKFKGNHVTNDVRSSNRLDSRILFCSAGHIFINKNKEYIFGASQVLYYALTTLSRLQTLGEEYTRIVQVGKSGRHIPSFSVSKRNPWGTHFLRFYITGLLSIMLSLAAKRGHDIGTRVWRPTYRFRPGPFYQFRQW